MDLLSEAVGHTVELDDALPLLHLGGLVPGGVLGEHGLGAQQTVLVLDHLVMQVKGDVLTNIGETLRSKHEG